MGMIGLYAARKGLLKDGLNILSAAALLMLVWNPYYLLDVSFQLSFLVTLGLMVYVPMIMPLLKKMPAKLAGAVGVTLVAQLVSFPLTITYFNQFSLLSFVANLILVPLITLLVLPLATIALLAGSVWLQGGRLAAQVVEWLDHLTFSIVEWMNGYPVFVTIWPSPSLAWTISYYIVMYMLLFFAKRWVYDGNSVVNSDEETVPLEEAMLLEKNNTTEYAGRLVKGATFACILLYSSLLFYAYQPEHTRGEGLVQFLDIGQGDSILITTPDGVNLLVDGGGTMQFGQPEEWSLRKDPFEVGAKVIVPLLKKRGIHALDAVILTHGDHDHAGGLQAVLEHIPVRSLLFNGTMGSAESVKSLFSTAIAKDIPIYAAQEGMVLKLDPHTELVFIYPEASPDENGAIREVKKQNHASLVFMLKMQERTFLFTGDIEQEGEADILHRLSSLTEQSNEVLSELSSLKQVDVMKIAHHGSKTSTTAAWLERWRPGLAVVSAGRNNSYGHPNDQVVERILGYGATLYQTNQHGEVQIRVKDGALWLRHKQ